MHKAAVMAAMTQVRLDELQHGLIEIYHMHVLRRNSNKSNQVKRVKSHLLMSKTLPNFNTR